MGAYLKITLIDERQDWQMYKRVACSLRFQRQVFWNSCKNGVIICLPMDVNHRTYDATCSRGKCIKFHLFTVLFHIPLLDVFHHKIISWQYHRNFLQNKIFYKSRKKAYRQRILQKCWYTSKADPFCNLIFFVVRL